MDRIRGVWNDGRKEENEEDSEETDLHLPSIS